jgi:hypothetical protein
MLENVTVSLCRPWGTMPFCNYISFTTFTHTLQHNITEKTTKLLMVESSTLPILIPRGSKYSPQDPVLFLITTVLVSKVTIITSMLIFSVILTEEEEVRISIHNLVEMQTVQQQKLDFVEDLVQAVCQRLWC